MGLSGVQRTLKFAKYLSRFGWEPTVVTCKPGGYFAYDDSLLKEIKAADIRVHRTSTWDPTRLFGTKKVVSLPPENRRRTLAQLSQFLFVPDNKIGWWWPAKRKAMSLLKEEPFDLVFSTAPPYSAHLIAASAARAAGLPLVLDFRDDWVGNPRHQYPTALHRSMTIAMERHVLRRTARTIVINDVIRRNLSERNADVVDPADVLVISQGYDAADFEAARGVAEELRDPSRFRILYSGVFYDAQTPEPFLRGLADLVRRRPDLRSKIDAVFVGLLPDRAVALARELGLHDLVRHVGYVSHELAVAHLVAADVLWMMIGRTEGAESISTSKLYEYFGSRKPVLGIVPKGAARDALLQYKAAELADPDAVAEVATAIEHLYGRWEASDLPRPAEAFVERFDRRRLAGRLAEAFDDVASTPGDSRTSGSESSILRTSTFSQ